MAGIRLNRHAKRRWHALVVWAIMPLAIFNTRTVVGCGCTGHFEAVCHCNCGNGCGKCNGSGSCPCCSNHRSTFEKSEHSANGSDDSTAFRGHHCKGAVQVEVVPATVVSVHSADEISVSAPALNVLDFTVAGEASFQVFVLEHSSPPPYDIVVALHRLVI